MTGRLNVCVTLSRDAGGRPRILVVDVDTGKGQSFPVPVLGGGAERMVYAGPVAGATEDGQALDPKAGAAVPSFLGDTRLEAFPSAPLVHPDAAIEDNASTAPKVTESHDGKVGLLDVFLRNGAALFVLDEHGNVTTHVADGRQFRVEMDEDGVARFARDEEADGRVPLVDPLKDELDKLTDRVNAIGSALKDVAAWASVAEATGTGVAWTGKYTGDTGPADSLAKADKAKMTAACIHVSADDESGG